MTDEQTLARETFNGFFYYDQEDSVFRAFSPELSFIVERPDFEEVKEELQRLARDWFEFCSGSGISPKRPLPRDIAEECLRRFWLAIWSGKEFGLEVLE
jgi:hypothetical protein